MIGIDSLTAATLWSGRRETRRPRYSLYLDEYPYGSFSTSMHKSGVFSFECVPEGRVLAIAAGTDKTIDAQELPVAQPSDAIEQVIAVSNNHDCVVLHGSR